LLEALRTVGLEAAVQRLGGLDVAHDWASALSQGEQHLVAVARLLLTRPHFAFLDQTAESLAEDQVELLYRVLSEAAITYLSIGDNHQLAALHHSVLELEENGQWRLAVPGGAARL
jgi:putative ATP-binding cassette transporter